MLKKFWYAYGLIIVRPRRWFFRNMIRNDRLQLLPKYNEYWERWSWPNIHWWILHETIFEFCHWLAWDGWRPFCDWTGGYRRTFPWIARIIKRIGETTAGVHCFSCECWHCGAEDCDQTTLAGDETDTTFILEETWSEGTQEGTDHRFRGITICPRCGYRAGYEDGSL